MKKDKTITGLTRSGIKQAVFINLLFVLCLTCTASLSMNIVSDEVQPIEKELAKQLRPRLKQWLDWYQLDINQFKQYPSTTFDLTSLEECYNTQGYNCLNCNKLTPEDFKYDSTLREYSPDNKYYIPLYELMVQYDPEEKKYFTTFDDSQNVWLYSKEKMLAYMVQFLGTDSLAEVTYWIDNNSFVLAGRSYMDNESGYFFCIFDITRQLKYNYFYVDKNKDHANPVPFYKHMLEHRLKQSIEW